jgi:hypothetical protein
MTVEQESERDLSLETDAAENVVGGTRKKRKSAHRATAPAPSAPASPTVGTPPGLGMGPDPDYPNPDGGADNLDV